MTNLNIDMAKFKKVCQDLRDSGLLENEGYVQLQGGVFECYRWELANHSVKAPAPVAAKTVADLRAELNVAARAAYTNGATPAQIDYIVALAEKAGDLNVIDGGRLTKAEASRIIDVLR